MAKILAPYALCPLAERKRFVGVSPDSESGCVIVTLARNIIIRYRLSNQKQVSSWSTKAMLSAPVIYDQNSKLYYGIFNDDEVSSWQEHVVSLAKLGKTKFMWLIHSIVSSDDVGAVIVYKNGVIGSLKADLALSKEPPNVKDDQLLPPEEVIKEARLVSLASVHYVALHTSTEAGETNIHFVPVDQDRGTKSAINLNRKGFKLTAFSILDGESPVLISLWSDGKLFSLSLPIKDSFPGKLISEVKCIDANHPATILQLGQEHFVLYGAAPNSEGAYLVILGRQFGLPESMVKMKVYDNECRMWTCRNNIVMVLGGHLVVAPFRLNIIKLASLIGVDKKIVDVNKENNSSILDNTAEDIATRIIQMKEEGHFEHFICDTVFSELLESKNTDGINVALDHISDIPDKWLVQLAGYSAEHEGLLRRILKLRLSGDASTQSLVKQKLMLPTVLKIMSVVTEMLKDDDIDQCILDWACLLCDTHYLQCLLSKDEQVVSTTRELYDAVEEHIESMVTYRSLLAEINYLKRGKVTSNTPPVSSHSYVVEKIKLY